MGRCYIQIDKSNIPDEIIFDSQFINSQEELSNTELGWSEIREAIIRKITIKQEKYLGESEEIK